MIALGMMAGLTLAGGVAAVALRNLVHCALAAGVAFAGLAGMYLHLGAEFVGFAQVLVYIGAVAILIVFAILLTRGMEPSGEPLLAPNALAGLAVAVAVFGVLATVILSSKSIDMPDRVTPPVSVQQLGEELMTRYILPLEVLGLLLTAALIGAVIIALREPEPE